MNLNGRLSHEGNVSGSLGGGVSSYSLLTDKPKINNHTIDGEMTAADLDLQDKIDFPEDGTKYLDGEGNFTTPPRYTPISYTTTEQDTGMKWIDGRTIYQITSSVQTDTNCDNTHWAYLPLDNAPINPQELIHGIIHGQVPNTNRTYRFQANNNA